MFFSGAPCPLCSMDHPPQVCLLLLLLGSYAMPQVQSRVPRISTYVTALAQLGLVLTFEVHAQQA